MFGKKNPKETTEQKIEKRLGRIKNHAGKKIDQDVNTVVKSLARSDN
ncbi:MAG: hypothetical protein JXB14_02270 [Candidatus Altiarchaeota archaeon]|nr:hypothetical protein [Candidatus Altiarchaeota archaeon]